MTRDDLKRLFPNASEAFLSLHLDGEAPRPIVERPAGDGALAVDYPRQGASQQPEKAVRKFWTETDLEVLELYYAASDPSTFSLRDAAKVLGRTEAAIALKASKMGYTMPRGKRVFSSAHKENIAVAQTERMKNPVEREKLRQHAIQGHAKYGHPRGMLGKHHGQAAKDAISAYHTGKKIPRERVEKAMRTKAANGTLFPPRLGCSWKAGWVEIGGQKFYARSRWEANYGRYLEWLKTQGQIKAWRHEPTTFWFPNIKRGCVSYLPDFEVTANGIEFHEVKGWMDSRSKTKIRRMAKYHPQVVLKVIDGPKYKALAKQVSGIVPDWAK